MTSGSTEKPKARLQVLRARDITPELLLELVAQQLPDCKEEGSEVRALFVVGIDENGQPRFWSTQDFHLLPTVAIAWHDLATRAMNGLLESAEDGGDFDETP
jgi:hypothetical protein